MKKVRAQLHTLPAMAVIVGLCLVCQTADAQCSSRQSSAMAQQSDLNSAAEMKTFAGIIVKFGDKLVLAEAENGTTFQLDGQQRAQEFVDKKMKVSGVLDTVTGRIRVSAIVPA